MTSGISRPYGTAEEYFDWLAAANGLNFGGFGLRIRTRDLAIALNSAFSEDSEEADRHADTAWDVIQNYIIPSAME